jgi:uncharacterized zinc-type alcohol dehydrogenase-like protein
VKNVKARAKPAADKNHEKIAIERRELDKQDVLIEIKFAGICHSDIHTGRGEWDPNIHYPIVTGHEIAGIVKEVGSDVTTYKEGDRVGVGCMVGSCMECENCKNGEEQFCLKGMVGTYNGVDKYGKHTDGGYSTHIVVPEHFVLRIPDSIELDKAAPLLCAGITTYSPLNHWKAGEKRVAIVGMGGLGHMAVQIAHAMGAHVTVLSRTLDKQDDGKKLGADEYYATEDEKTFEKLAKSFDLILNTVSAKLPLDDFLGLLKVNGTMVNVGAPAEPLELRVQSLIGGRRSFAGSLIGGIKETQQMLDFCGEHAIAPMIETISADQIDEAWDNVVDSNVRYRYVIDAATI